MLLLGFHGTTKKNLYPKLSNKKWAPPCGWCPFFCFGKICERRCLGSLHRFPLKCERIKSSLADLVDFWATSSTQIIDRRYGQSPNHSHETIYVAAVFDGSQRRIGAWAEVKQN